MGENARVNDRNNSSTFTSDDSLHHRSLNYAVTDECSDANLNDSIHVHPISSPCEEFSLRKNQIEAAEADKESIPTMGSAKASDQMTYTINDVPPWYLCIALGFQQFLTMLGSTIALPSVLAPLMCIGHGDMVAKGELLGTLFFVSGFATVVQTTFGTRLPIVQGGTFSFLVSAMAILSLDKWKCPEDSQLESSSIFANESVSNASSEEGSAWRSRMLEIQGAIIVASLFEVVIGVTGMIGVMMRFISPITIATCISLIGMSLFRVASSNCSGNWWIAFMTMTLIALFSQYLRNISIPCFTIKDGKFRRTDFPLFRLFPIIIAISLSWFVCYILTITDAVPDDPNHWAYKARTDIRRGSVENAAWFRVPYPFQWGIPTFSVASAFGMMPAVLAGIVESIGDYYACARISGAPRPPVHVINRGIFAEGVLCVLAGIFGTGTGTTSYSENVGAISITKAGSRRIIQTSGLIMMVCGVLGKFGALFITIPTPVIGGMFMVMFGMIAAVGISNLQYVDINSSRNLFIFGFSFIVGLSVPDWLQANPKAINTGSEVFDQIVSVLGNTSMFIGGALALILDSTVPGTDEERGLCKWLEEHTKADNVGDNGADKSPDTTYDLPFGMTAVRRWNWTRYFPICPTFNGFSVCKESGSCCERIGKEKSEEDGIQRLAYNSSTTGKHNQQPTVVQTNKTSTSIPI